MVEEVPGHVLVLERRVLPEGELLPGDRDVELGSPFGFGTACLLHRLFLIPIIEYSRQKWKQVLSDGLGYYNPSSQIPNPSIRKSPHPYYIEGNDTSTHHYYTQKMFALRRLTNSFSHHVYNKIVRHTDSKVGVIFLNSPTDLNALSTQLKDEIVHCLDEYEKDPAIRAIALLSKVEKAFCAGANIKDFEGKRKSDFAANDIFEPLHAAFERTTKPIISGINGVALGGGFEMALLTDILVCADNARFGLPELKLGLIPGIGGTQRLTRIVGKINAMKYILSSEFIPAKRAYELGIVSDVFPKQELHAKTLDLARQISEKPLSALRAAKDAIKQADEQPLESGVKYERKIFYPLFDTHGAIEGISAFIEKRAANFDDKKPQ